MQLQSYLSSIFDSSQERKTNRDFNSSIKDILNYCSSSVEVSRIDVKSLNKSNRLKLKLMERQNRYQKRRALSMTMNELNKEQKPPYSSRLDDMSHLRKSILSRQQNAQRIEVGSFMKSSQQSRGIKRSQLLFRKKSQFQLGIFGQANRRLQDQIKQKKLSYNMLECLLQNYESLLMSFHEHDEDEIIRILDRILFSCQEKQNKEIFLKILILICQFYYDINNMNKSAFFVRQCFIAAHSLKAYDQIIQSLMHLSRLANTTKQYDSSLLFLKKALQYAWYCKNTQIETQLYDLIGIALYYQGEVQTALVFHNKYMSNVLEDQLSAERIESMQQIEDYENQNCEKHAQLNKFIMNRLSLPIRNYFLKNHQIGDQYKTMTFTNCQIKPILKFALKDIKYKEIKLDLLLLKQPSDYFASNYYKYFKMIDKGLANTFQELSNKDVVKTKQNPNIFFYIGNAPHSEFPNILIDIKKRHNLQVIKHKEQIQDINRLNYSLDQKMEIRNKNINKMQGAFDRVCREVSQRKTRMDNTRWDQIYIKHLNHAIPHKEGFINQKFRFLLDQIILQS